MNTMSSELTKEPCFHQGGRAHYQCLYQKCCCTGIVCVTLMKHNNTKKDKREPFVLSCLFAEGEGFKPPIPERGIPDFESSAIDHSANLPFTIST